MKTGLRILVLAAAFSLAACGGAEDRKSSYLEKAKAYLAEGNLDKARIEAKNALQISPKDVEGRILLGQILEKSGNLRGALGNYLRAAELDEKNVEARLNIGWIYARSPYVKKIDEMAEAVLKIDPQNSSARLLKAIVFIKSKQPEKARPLVDEVYAKEPGNVRAISLNASLSLIENKPDQAIAILEKGIQQNKTELSLYSQLTQIYVARKDLKSAIATLEKIIQQKPELLKAYVAVYSMHARMGNKDAALSTLNRAIANVGDKDKVRARALLVTHYMRARQPDAAISKLKEYIAEDKEEYQYQFMLARVYLAKRDIPNMTATYQAIVDADGEGKSAQSAMVKLALIDLRKGNRDKAEALINKVLELNAKSIEALVVSGNIAMMKQDYPTAIAQYRAVLKATPSNALIHSYLANAQFRSGNKELGEQSLINAMKAKPADLRYRLRLVQYYVSQKNNEAAIKLINEGLKAAPGNILLLKALAELQIVEKSWLSLKDTTNEIKSSKRFQALGYFLDGVAAYQQKNFDVAESAFRQALAISPNYKQAVVALVKVYIDTKQVNKAVAYLNDRISKNPADLYYYDLLGRVYLSQKNTKAVEGLLKSAVEKNSKNPVTYRSLGAYYMAKGRTDDAIAVYKKGLKSVSGNMSLQFVLAAAYQQKGNQAEAVSLYRALLKKSPNSVMIRNNMAMALISPDSPSKGDIEQANKLVEGFDKLKNPLLLDTAGWVRYKSGKYDEAIELLKRANELNGKIAELQYHLGMAYLMKGDASSAKLYLEKAVSNKQVFADKDKAKAALDKLGK